MRRRRVTTFADAMEGDTLHCIEPASLSKKATKHGHLLFKLVVLCIWTCVVTNTIRRFMYNYKFYDRRQEEARMVLFRVCGDADGLDLARDFVKCEDAKIASVSGMIWIDAIRATAADTVRAIFVVFNQELTRSVQTAGVIGALLIMFVIVLYLLAGSIFSTRDLDVNDFYKVIHAQATRQHMSMGKKNL